MLTRCKCRPSLVPHLIVSWSRKVPGIPWGRLEPSVESHRDSEGKRYLPYKTHSVFDRLGEDWIEIVQLGVPQYDKFPHLVTTGALHVLLYQLDTAIQYLNRAARGSHDL